MKRTGSSIQMLQRSKSYTAVAGGLTGAWAQSSKNGKRIVLALISVRLLHGMAAGAVQSFPLLSAALEFVGLAGHVVFAHRCGVKFGKVEEPLSTVAWKCAFHLPGLALFHAVRVGNFHILALPLMSLVYTAIIYHGILERIGILVAACGFAATLLLQLTDPNIEYYNHDCCNIAILISVFGMLGCLIGSASIYQKDAILVLLEVGGTQSLITAVGGWWEGWGMVFALRYVMIMLIATYGQFLFVRYARHLPPGLAGAKFVRLGYYRKMQRQGMCVSQCQKLPPEAFSDPHKASYVVILSHRWLDRYKCDMASESCPNGIRLNGILRELDKRFSFSPATLLAILRSGGGFWHAIEELAAALAGGWDVAIFHDFMALPQIGVDEDGNQIPRTPEEDRLFRECLPHMGLLYSEFPVLVLEEVVPGVHPYEVSGWCFCELNIANLGRQLSTYSIRFQQNFDTNSFEDTFEAQLNEKQFFNPNDRNVVSTIIRGFFLKRALVEAIEKHDLDSVRAIVEPLDEDRKRAIFDQSVDALLDTPLHLAVMRANSPIVEQLLRCGADPNLKNGRGDMPSQWLAFPRCSKAATLCRSHRRGDPMWRVQASTTGQSVCLDVAKEPCGGHMETEDDEPSKEPTINPVSGTDVRAGFGTKQCEEHAPRPLASTPLETSHTPGLTAANCMGA
eukprot:gnl/TRDRNA2_/TRDRNA2_147843_c0_seq1.p1 gnl/TRDRNA2_/TRDRNA2_147843_c0~~gnl/TRDRNA2_/TRDRNA2_147843_c0_seq1.p1  ORF type:complete len:678 (+),score=54.07 gnl/TRDRNA2_/TRDRNA2_147843_c0_seq1:80-2113(+)